MYSHIRHSLAIAISSFLTNYNSFVSRFIMCLSCCIENILVQCVCGTDVFNQRNFFDYVMTFCVIFVFGSGVLRRRPFSKHLKRFMLSDVIDGYCLVYSHTVTAIVSYCMTRWQLQHRQADLNHCFREGITWLLACFWLVLFFSDVLSLLNNYVMFVCNSDSKSIILFVRQIIIHMTSTLTDCEPCCKLSIWISLAKCLVVVSNLLWIRMSVLLVWLI